MKFGEDGFVSTGFYRTRDGRIVAILGPHPNFIEGAISPAWSQERPTKGWWWNTGVHPYYFDKDLIERIEPQDA